MYKHLIRLVENISSSFTEAWKAKLPNTHKNEMIYKKNSKNFTSGITVKWLVCNEFINLRKIRYYFARVISLLKQRNAIVWFDFIKGIVSSKLPYRGYTPALELKEVLYPITVKVFYTLVDFNFNVNACRKQLITKGFQRKLISDIIFFIFIYYLFLFH